MPPDTGRASLREAGDRVRLVWMGNTVEAVVVTVKTKGRTTRYQVQIDGVRGHPWYEESELTSV